MDQDEKNNIIATFKASLDSIFDEKLKQEKWKEKVNNFNAKVNFAVLVGDGNKEKIYLSLVSENGEVNLSPGMIDDADFELAATFDVFFNIATGEANAILALLMGKLKVKNLLKNFKKVLFLQKFLVLEK